MPFHCEVVFWYSCYVIRLLPIRAYQTNFSSPLTWWQRCVRTWSCQPTKWLVQITFWFSECFAFSLKLAENQDSRIEDRNFYKFKVAKIVDRDYQTTKTRSIPLIPVVLLHPPSWICFDTKKQHSLAKLELRPASFSCARELVQSHGLVVHCSWYSDNNFRERMDESC